MFAHEFILSFFILSFAALLCLFGAVMLIDGIIRLTAQWYRRLCVAPATRGEQVEKPGASERAA